MICSEYYHIINDTNLSSFMNLRGRHSYTFTFCSTAGVQRLMFAVWESKQDSNKEKEHNTGILTSGSVIKKRIYDNIRLHNF